MGAFFLSRECVENDEQQLAVIRSFKKQGFTDIVNLSSREQALFYCRKVNVSEDSYYHKDDGNFCIITGTLIYKKEMGNGAAKRIFDDFSNNYIDVNQLYGNFALVISLKSEIHVYTDTQGVYNVWHNEALTVVSSSFLALAESIKAPTINADAVYEYIFQETTFGGDTVLNEVRRLKVKHGIQIGKESSLIAPLTIASEKYSANSVGEQLERSAQALANQFEAIVACFSDNIDSALSGGYDSRLLLALCCEQGVTPHLHVYGSDNDADVQVAKQVCSGIGIKLSHEDKSGYPKVSPEEFELIVEQNYYAFQAVCPDGILDNGSDLLTRHQRTKGGRLLLNGGGGEVFRNFFYLPDKSYRTMGILWSFYSRFDPSVCTERFNEKRYYQVLESKINEILGVDGGTLSRQQVEYLYAGFRCTYWMGLNNSINNQFGYFLTPFVEELISMTALPVSIKNKNYGQYQANLIKKVSPELAQYTSDYGHNFADAVPFKRKLKDLTTLVRPTLLRKYTYRMRKHSRQNWPYYLADNYIAKVLPDGWQTMPAFFVIDKMADQGQFKRAVTLEYLFQKLNATP
ncbi:MAG: hypothetical protein COB62_07260 [Piscirickettsiaceae bacterium]|nr:MAG: hypothetical protein COB62_07260 [Piscirickettsiaceae bacterium]